MVKWYSKLKIIILTSDLFRRRYTVYSNKEETEFYIRTTKVLTLPKYINFSNKWGDSLIICRGIKQAEKKCKLESLKKAKDIITRYKREYDNTLYLKYHQVWQN